MEANTASSSDEGAYPRKRQKQDDGGDRPNKHQSQRNGILAGDGSNITARDQFFGGFHHHQHGAPPVGDSATSSTKALIESLSFPTMNSRRDYISEECPHTCKWLLDTDEWTQWRQSFELTKCPRLLWIKGHPGSGKSTIMKYAYRHALRREKHSNKHSKEIVLAHFFNARAKEKLDKSTEGMYRTILVQLLQDTEATNIPGDVARRALGGKVDWHVENLLELFREILRTHADRPVTCFVDALDECDDQQVRDMIQKFRDLMEKDGEGVRVQLRVFFSSRNYPRILTPPPDKAICMQLEDQPGHARDITNYIDSYLQVYDSPIAQEVKVGVQEKARGSFIWCKLVIDLLNKDDADARLDRTLYLRERLAAIPPELDALFAKVLGMNGEGQVSDPETILCMQWVLFSMRELTPQELWWAIQRGVEPQTESAELAARYQPEYSERYILWASRGLVEIVMGKRREWTVQVIHESVRDFLLGQGKLAKLIGLEAREEEAVARSHEQLKRICWDELFVHAAHNSIIQGGYGSSKLRHKLAKELPLLFYATEQMVQHANAAQRCGVTSMDQQQFLDDLERHREQFKMVRIASIDHPRISFSRQVNATMIEILLHANAEALIEPQHRRMDAAGVAAHRFGLEACSAVAQALRHRGRNEFVKAVIDVHLRRHSLGDPRRDLLLAIGANRSFYWGRSQHDFADSLFDLACTNQNLGLFFLVAALPVTRDATELLASQPRSILGKFHALLLLILTNPLEFENFQDSLDLEEALRWAARQGDIVMAQVLLDKYHVDINSSPSSCGTPLHYAAKKGHQTMVQFLLARDGIEPDLRDNNNETPLYHACSFPILSFGPTTDEEVTACNITRRLLATRKVDVNARSNDSGQTLLHTAAEHEGSQLVEALLAAPGVNVNARNSSGETPLHMAIVLGTISVVETFLDTAKIDVNARTSTGSSPLHYAVKQECAESVELLLAAPGVDVDARNSDNETPLHIICDKKRGDQSIAKMLLDTEKVDVNSQTKDGKTPRDLALKWQHKDMAKLLSEYINRQHNS